MRTLRHVDVDGDGRLDRLDVGPDGSLAISLNLGRRQYQSVGQALPVSPSAGPVASVVAGDLNGDGSLDLYLVSPAANVALLGDGTGAFREATALLRLEDSGRGLSAERVDVDGDGLDDLLLHNEDRDVVFWAAPGGVFERDELAPGQALVSLPPVSAGASAAESTTPSSPPTDVQASRGNRRAVLGSGASSANLSGGPSLGSLQEIAGPSAFCASSLVDQSNGSCGLQASSVATLGMLMPLSSHWFIEAATGNVGIGTTSPTQPLDVNGTVRARSGGVEFPDGTLQTRAAVDLFLEVAQLDQVNTGVEGEWDGAWQSFTAGASGKLVSIDLGRGPFAVINGFPGQLTFYAGEGSGGSVLSSQTVAAPSSTGLQSITVATPFDVVSGQKYTVQFFGDAWHYDDGNAYAAGVSSVNADWDMTFRTYVANPQAAFEITSDNHVEVRSDLLVQGSAFVGADSGALPSTVGAGVRTFYDSTTGSGQIFSYDYGTGAAQDLLLQGPGGNVGIGTLTPMHLLEVNGSAAKPGGGSWTSTSDRRLKKNIADLEGALQTLLALRGVTYEYKDPETLNELPGTRVGFIAQEVEEVLPDWVDEAADGFKRLTIRGFEALSVEALRELDAELARLRADNEALRALVEGLSKP